VATILISFSIVKRLLWRASPVARGGGRFYSGGWGRPPAPDWRRRCRTGEIGGCVSKYSWLILDPLLLHHSRFFSVNSVFRQPESGCVLLLVVM